MMARILAVDPGEKRIGVAISDPSATLAAPLTVIPHHSRREDANKIVRLAEDNQVETIIVGQSVDEQGELKPMGRHAARLAEEIRAQSGLPVLMWDEHGSTQAARRARIEMGVKRSKRSGHLDDLAAAVILQSYLEENEQRLKE